MRLQAPLARRLALALFRAGAAAPALADAGPRAVAPRGPLSADEQDNVRVFRAASPSTVHITTLEAARSLFSRDVLQVPRGTGTGFNAPRERLAPIAMGASHDLAVGQKVYAIGNPFGLDQTLTTGIISALDRQIESVTQRSIRGVIQTDAAINPGNSGGPLLDSSGRLIGVNTAIFSPSGASAGIGFAIPVDEVNRIVPRLIRDGKFVRPALGILPAPPRVQAALRIQKGVAVIGVVPGSGAAAAGMQAFRRGPGGELLAGDVVVGVGGKDVATLDDMLDELERRQPGDIVAVAVLRGGRRLELKVRLGEAE